MITLTKAQSKAIRQNGANLARVVDPETQETYVLIKATVYEEMAMALQEGGVRALEPFLAELAPEDWEEARNYIPSS